MENVKIVISCDTTVALNREEINNLGVEMIPLNAIVNGTEYHDSIDIDSEKLSKLMREGAKVTTSTPTIDEIENYFDDIFERTKADYIIHFPISSKLSSMYSLFTNVCKEKYGDKVIVFDTLSICEMQANQVRYAKYLADHGSSVKEITDKINQELVNTEHVVFVPESLEYLRKGGRLSPAVATLANLIGVIPILTFENGLVGKKGVTRTLRKAFYNALTEWKDTYPDLENNYDIFLLKSDSATEDKANKAIDLVHEIYPEAKVGVRYLSLNVTAHTGPGTFGLALIKKINY